MGVLVTCDKCGRPVSTIYNIRSRTSKSKKFVLSPENIWSPDFECILCESCSIKVHKFIRGSASD